MEETRESVPNRQAGLLEEIDEAKRNALHEDELEPIKDQQDDLTRRFLSGEIGSAEYKKTIKALDIQAGIIKRRDIAGYALLLRAIGIPESEVRETLSHENEHMMESTNLGVNPVYQIQFVRTKTEGLGMYPSVNFDFPDSMPEDEQRRILSAIIEAPADLSARDKTQLGRE